ncbi:MAG: von Willebrand factor type A domain-containing protein [Chitinophagaceae bacterium]
MRYVLFSCLLAAFSLLSFNSRNSITIHGKVTDDKAAAMTGVSIQEKGHAKVTATDANGDFSIAVSNEKAVLVFSAVGYKQKEVAIKNRTNINVSLAPVKQNLQEVVVVGYGVKRKMDYTGSVSTMAPGIILQSSPVYNALQGKVAGINVTGNRQPYKSAEHEKKYRGVADAADKDYDTEDYNGIVENRFLTVAENALSTFSIDVDAASYSNVRRYLEMGQLPPAGAVRIEEMINYFHYDYPQPVNEAPFSINTEMAACPWNTAHRLVLIGLQGKKIPVENLPASNLVFLIDVSGSMMGENRLPLVKASMKLLVDQLREQDKVSMVVYAGNAGLVLPATSGAEKTTIKDAIDKLEAGGSTAGGAGIQLAYKTAKENFVKTGNNRVILCTDGDFNVGASSDDALVSMVEEERKSGVFLTVLGYGMGNYKDNKMEKLADKGNGNHAYIDGISEAKKVLVNEFGGTLFTIAKDVKLQIEFNPAKVQAYRLIGYENRLLNKEDFNNDKKDAGELGSGHTVTALYEVIPVGVKNEFMEDVDKLKYQQPGKAVAITSDGEIMTIKFRYKKPDGEQSKLIVHPVMDNPFYATNTAGNWDAAGTSSNFRFAAAVAQFGMLLRNSEFKQSSSYNKVLQMATEALGKDEEGYRSEFLKLIKHAQSLAKQEKKKTVDEEDDEDVSMHR